MNIESFLQKNAKAAELSKKVEFDRFGEPFVIEAITETENDGLKKAATTKRRSKAGNIVSDLNTDMYSDALLTRCVKVPDLRNAQLQESYGTVGDAAGTLKAMLLSGEYALLTKEVLELNGFDDGKEEELKDEVKN